MSTLICNAAEGLLQIVLTRDNAVLCAQEWPAPTRSTEILAPALAHMLQELAMQPRDISRIACVHGPGSFTGIRLVLSTAAALRRAIGATVAPLDYMEALAVSAYLRLQDLPHSAGHDAAAATSPSDAPKPQMLWVLTHARRNLVHCQPFSLPSQREDIPQALAAVDLCSLEVCAQRVNTMPSTPLEVCPKRVNSTPNAMPTPPLCVGSGLLRNQAYFNEHCPQAHFGGPSYAIVRLSALVYLAQQANYAHDDLTPLYVRPCDAVENLPAMAHKLGQDAATAEQHLKALLVRPTSPDQTYRPA